VNIDSTDGLFNDGDDDDDDDDDDDFDGGGGGGGGDILTPSDLTSAVIAPASPTLSTSSLTEFRMISHAFWRIDAPITWTRFPQSMASPAHDVVWADFMYGLSWKAHSRSMLCCPRAMPSIIPSNKSSKASLVVVSSSFIVFIRLQLSIIKHAICGIASHRDAHTRLCRGWQSWSVKNATIPGRNDSRIVCNISKRASPGLALRMCSWSRRFECVGVVELSLIDDDDDDDDDVLLIYALP
jgi:hypothetical protein